MSKKMQPVLIRSANYGGEVRQRRDGDFDATFLYNMAQPTRSHTIGDISEVRVYKTKNAAITKIEQYIKKKGE